MHLLKWTIKAVRNFQRGQLIITLILILTIILALGLSVVQKGLVNVSTSTRTEQSSRAFSAAEAGIEQALLKGAGQGGTNNSPVAINSSDNTTTFDVKDQDLYPAVPAPGSGIQQDGLEFPSFAKEDVAQVWLANFNDSANPPAEFYKPDASNRSLEVYWGDPAVALTDPAAISVKILYYDPTNGYQFMSSLKPFDPVTDRATKASFTDASAACGNVPVISTNFSKATGVKDRTFYCKEVISLPPLPAQLMLVRLRLLYNSTSQPLAVRATGSCDTCRIPSQARMIISTGVSGNVQRKVEVLKQEKIVPPYFDYAIFSAGEIAK